jgi:DNA mismatch repair protein MutS
MEPFSLLWPPGTLSSQQVARNHLEPDTIRDLGLEHLVRMFAHKNDQQKAVHDVLATLVQDVEVIRYRQEVFAELVEHPRLAASFENLLPTIDALSRYSYQAGLDKNTLHEVTWRLGELQSTLQCIQGLDEILSLEEGRTHSEGFQLLHKHIKFLQNDPVYQQLMQKLPELMSELRTCASITIGVNLDPLLRPVEAALLSVNEERFTSQSLLSRLFGGRISDQEGIAPLHEVPLREVEGPYPFHVDPELGRSYEPIMVPLFRDLALVIEKITRPLAKEIKRYAGIKSELFIHLRQDLYFYLGALRFIARLRGHGLPVCRPELTDIVERVLLVEEAYNPNLVGNFSKGNLEVDLAGRLVCNEIKFDAQGRILILTGPNQGGKTTYIQSCGLIQVLAQAGLFIPGKQARLCPVDHIYTHFATEEKPDSSTGRFGDEAKRLGQIFEKLTPYSLVLLNETFSSTNAGESLYLAQDVVRILRRLGTRCIYSTHLHELAAEVERINQDTPGESRLVSLVSSPIDETKSAAAGSRSYRIEERPPMGRSYAAEIAARYGISYQQLQKTLQERGLLDNAD